MKISAVNNTGGTFGSFGFQLVTVFDSASGTSSAAQAGSWGALPSSVRSTPASGGNTFPIIEQSSSIVATSGSGGNGTVYSKSIPWTAPAAGAGAVKIYGVLNAVSGWTLLSLVHFR